MQLVGADIHPVTAAVLVGLAGLLIYGLRETARAQRKVEAAMQRDSERLDQGRADHEAAVRRIEESLALQREQLELTRALLAEVRAVRATRREPEAEPPPARDAAP